MYNLVLYVLRFLIIAALILSFFGVISYTWWHLLVNLVLLILFCLLSNLLFAKVLRVKTNYESQYITAEILALIVGPLNPITDWWILAAVSFLAMASKYIFVYKKQHIFNPAGFGVLASALLLEQGASWWVGNMYTMPLVLIGGFLIARKLRWFHLLLSFFISYFAALIISLTLQGLDTNTILLAIKNLVVNSPLLFFATIMLVEPITAPKGKNWRIVYGALVALFNVGLQYFWPNYGYSIETGLLLGNLVSFAISPKTFRQTLLFIEKKQESKDTYSFWFEPYKRFAFVPGQFMEWTLAHPKQDSRGLRRFFSISSSPTESRIRLITRFYQKPSTYKQALMNMAPGDEIVVSGLEGDFVLDQKNNKHAFIAGGVGIAPFLSIMKEMVDKKIHKDIILFYSSKTVADIAFQDLTIQAEKFGVKTLNVVTEPDEKWDGLKGFITPEMIKNSVPDWNERMFYVSGPEPMVMNYEQMLSQMGLPAHQIKRDYFPGYQA